MPPQAPASNVHPHALHPRVSVIALPIVCCVVKPAGHAFEPAFEMHKPNGAGFGTQMLPASQPPPGAPARSQVRPT